jgi:hypothetical protein
LLKKGHLLRFPHPSLLRRTIKYASLLRISGALHLALFEQPEKEDFFRSLLPIPSFRKSSNVFILGFRNSKNCNSFRGVYLG